LEFYIFSWRTCGIIAGRIIHVFPLTWLSNIRRRRKITFKEQFAVAYAGLRGALAFALALKTSSLGLPHAPLIVSTTLSIAMFTTLFQGSTTRPLLKCLDIKASIPQNDGIPASSSFSEQFGAALVPTGSINSDGTMAVERPSWFGRFDVKYIKRIFVSNPAVSGGGTKAHFAELARGLTQLTYKKRLDTHKQILYDLLLKFSAVHAVPSRTYQMQNEEDPPPLEPEPTDMTSRSEVPSHYHKTVIVEIPIEDETSENAFSEDASHDGKDTPLSPESSFDQMGGVSLDALNDQKKSSQTTRTTPNKIERTNSYQDTKIEMIPRSRSDLPVTAKVKTRTTGTTTSPTSLINEPISEEQELR